MVAEKGYGSNIEFVRIMNLLGLHKEPAITKERFMELLEPARRELMKRYSRPDFDANECIKNDPDYKLTYDGYSKFLKNDLKYSSIRNACLSGKKFKAKVHETAKEMIARGVVSVSYSELFSLAQSAKKIRHSRRLSGSNALSTSAFPFTPPRA